MEVLSVSRSTQLYRDYPLHQHGCWEIIFSLEGCGKIRVADKVYPFDEKTILCIPPYTPHCKRADDGFIDGCIFVREMELSLNDDVFLFQDDHNSSLKNLFQLAYETQLKGGPNTQQVLNSIGDVIFHLLTDLPNLHQRKHSEAVEQFQQLLLENISNCDFDIAVAMKATGYSDSYFRKVFKEELGTSPVEYFTKLRIRQAKQQLRQYYGSRSIAEIAESAGFSDPYYFSRKFRQYEHKSPRQYISELDDFDRKLLSEDLIALGDDPEANLRRQKQEGK